MNFQFYWRVYCVLFFASLITINAQWVQLNGPNESINSFTTSGSNIFAGTLGGGVYISNDYGASWSPRNSGLNNKTIWCLTSLKIDNNDLIVAGTIGSGIFTSTNNGISWETNSNILSNESIWALTSITNTDGSTEIYAGIGGKGVFVSKDLGKNWVPISKGLTDTFILSLTTAGNALFASTGSGIFRTNNKTDWEQLNTGLTNPYVWTLLSKDSKIIAGTRGGGIFISTNQGKNWSSSNYGLTNKSILSLAMSGNSIIAGTEEGGNFISTDSGNSWKFLSNTISGLGIKAILIKESYLFAATDNGTWKLSTHTITEATKSDKIPTTFFLGQNFPNPFNPTTTVPFTLNKSGNVTLRIFDQLGRLIKSFTQSYLGAGQHSLQWNGKNEIGEYSPSGVYFYQLLFNETSQIKKMILMK